MRKLVIVMAVALTPDLASAQTMERPGTLATAQTAPGQPSGKSVYGPPAPSPEPTRVPAARSAKDTSGVSDQTPAPKHHGHRRRGFVGTEAGGVVGH